VSVPAGGFRLAAIDIDDTLVGHDARIGAENRHAVRALVGSGVRVVLASGRSHANMLRFHHELALGDGPVISAQGAMVRDVESGQFWHRDTAPEAAVERATVEGFQRGLTVQHYRGDGIYIQARTEWNDYDQSRNATPHVLVPSLEETGWDGVFKVIWLGDPDEIAARAPEVRARYAGELAVVETDPGYLELTPPHANKAVALQVVADRLGIGREQVLAFGDGNNDVGMLSWAGLGIAMSHGRASAREAADLVSPGGDAESALARAIALVLAAAGGAEEREVVGAGAGVG